VHHFRIRRALLDCPMRPFCGGPGAGHLPAIRFRRSRIRWPTTLLRRDWRRDDRLQARDRCQALHDAVVHQTRHSPIPMRAAPEVLRLRHGASRSSRIVASPGRGARDADGSGGLFRGARRGCIAVRFLTRYRRAPRLYRDEPAVLPGAALRCSGPHECGALWHDQQRPERPAWQDSCQDQDAS
jgi:hypothetical protein